jgi:hypothetical protein
MRACGHVCMCAGVQVSVRASVHGAVLSAVRSAAGARTGSRGRRCKGATYGSVSVRTLLLLHVLVPLRVLVLLWGRCLKQNAGVLEARAHTSDGCRVPRRRERGSAAEVVWGQRGRRSAWAEREARAPLRSAHGELGEWWRHGKMCW